MNQGLALAAVIALLCLGVIAHADVFNLGTGFVNLETVTVGDPGNASERTGEGTPENHWMCGSVGYNYNIGKYEVTAKQYTDFLNNKAKCDGDPHSLYNTAMWSNTYGCKIRRTGGGTTANPYVYTVANDLANRPVNYVSYWDACRFANWLGNGQGNGDTETGAYTLTPSGVASNTITRNAGWNWAVTSEDEWYKAAYYKGGGTDAGYWDWPMQSDMPANPSNDITDPDDGNNANFDDPYDIGLYMTDVGEFENSESAYGTFDQGGNVSEWNEAIVNGASRGLRGGSYLHYSWALDASIRLTSSPTGEFLDVGFRVSEVPEPASLLVLLCGIGALPMLSPARRKC